MFSSNIMCNIAQLESQTLDAHFSSEWVSNDKF